MMCSNCGGLIAVSGGTYRWVGSWCACPKLTITPGYTSVNLPIGSISSGLPNPYGSSSHCPPKEHCWCKKVSSYISINLPLDHLQCCNCGLKKKK